MKLNTRKVGSETQILYCLPKFPAVIRIIDGSEISTPIVSFKDEAELFSTSQRVNFFQLNCTSRSWTPRKPIDWPLATDETVLS